MRLFIYAIVVGNVIKKKYFGEIGRKCSHNAHFLRLAVF